MSTANDAWGRVADDGTVYVRTAEGERVVSVERLSEEGEGANGEG